MSDAADDALAREVTMFAGELGDLEAGVLPGAHGPFQVVIGEGAPTHVIVRQPGSGIPLAVDGVPLLHLTTTFRCTWDSARQFLAVNKSSLAVSVTSSDEPLFRYDYLADGDGKIPAAHLNVHGHRDELVFAMMSAGKKLRGRARAAAVRGGRIPRLASFHFALGGHRYRPSLEDVLEMTVREFGVDTQPTWDDAIRAGRARWREKQLRAAVRDDPNVAADALRQLGFDVAPPNRPPARRIERIHAPVMPPTRCNVPDRGPSEGAP